jgi:hypothetical protein
VSSRKSVRKRRGTNSASPPVKAVVAEEKTEEPVKEEFAEAVGL